MNCDNNRTYYSCKDFKTPRETRVLYNNNNCNNRSGHDLRFVNIPQTRVDFGIPFFNLNN